MTEGVRNLVRRLLRASVSTRPLPPSSDRRLWSFRIAFGVDPPRRNYLKATSSHEDLNTCDVTEAQRASLLAQMVDHIEIELHKTFDNPIRILHSPFVFEESAWGSFDVSATLFYHENFARMHNVKFIIELVEGSDHSHDHTFALIFRDVHPSIAEKCLGCSSNGSSLASSHTSSPSTGTPNMDISFSTRNIIPPPLEILSTDLSDKTITTNCSPQHQIENRSRFQDSNTFGSKSFAEGESKNSMNFVPTPRRRGRPKGSGKTVNGLFQVPRKHQLTTETSLLPSTLLSSSSSSLQFNDKNLNFHQRKFNNNIISGESMGLLTIDDNLADSCLNLSSRTDGKQERHQQFIDTELAVVKKLQQLDPQRVIEVLRLLYREMGDDVLRNCHLADSSVSLDISSLPHQLVVKILDFLGG